MTTATKKEIYQYPKIIMASYGSRELFGQWISAAFGFTVFFYYEVVIGLDVTLAALAFIIYQIWNAINDPITGYLMERIQFPWEKKYGIRRLPFIIGGGLLWLVSFLGIFLGPTGLDPVANKWLIFAWYVISLCLYDFFATLFDVNILSLYPDKFTGLKERRLVQMFGTILGIIGLVLAAVIPPMFITTGVAASYRTAATVTVLIGLVFMLFLIPGALETKKVRDLYKRRREEMAKEEKQPGFFATASRVLKNKRFVGKITLFFGYQVAVVFLQTSALYIVTFLLDAPASNISLLLGSMLVGALVATPLWMMVAQKLNNNRLISLLGGFLLVLTFIPMFFVNSMTGWIITTFAFGVALGNQWFIDPPTMGDVLDDVAVKTGRRDPSVYYGYQSFIFKLGQTSIAAVIALVHNLTGFVAGAPSLAKLRELSPTPDKALFGIRIHAAIVPAAVVLITTILFWKLYDLTPDKVDANKKILEGKNI